MAVRIYSAIVTLLLAATWGGGWIIADRVLRQWPDE